MRDGHCRFATQDLLYVTVWMAIYERHWPSDPIALNEWREVWGLEWGDRRIELAFVGEDMDSVDLSRRLDACLLTRSELFLGEDLLGVVYRPL